MFHKQSISSLSLSTKRTQAGSMLILAVFVLVVFLLLGSALVRILSSGDESLAYEVVGTRAYTAANTGAEFALQKLFPLNNNTALSCAVIGTPPNISNVEGLQNCQVSISCSEFSTPDAVTYYKIISMGQCALDGNNIASREIIIEARTL
jgi:MSHA biogenesis protein MshP